MTAKRFLQIEIVAGALVFAARCAVGWGYLSTGELMLLMLDAAPYFLAALGIILSYRQPEIPDRKLVTGVIVGVAILFFLLARSARRSSEASHTKEISDLQKRLDAAAVTDQNILSGMIPQSKHTELDISESTEMERRQRILRLLTNEYILTHKDVSSAMVNGTASPPANWINARLHDLGAGFTVSDSGRSDQKPLPGMRLDLGPDPYHSVTDDQIAQLILDEADKIGEWTKNQETDIRADAAEHAERRESDLHWFGVHLAQKFQGLVTELRSEALRRLGPPGYDIEEEQFWNLLWNTQGTPGRMTTPADMTNYLTYFKRFGTELRRRANTTPEPTPLVVSEKPLASTSVEITLATKIPVRRGYIAIEYRPEVEQARSELSPCFRLDEVNNQDLIAFMHAHRLGGNVECYIVGEEMRFVPNNPIHIYASGSKQAPHVTQALLFMDPD